MNQDDDPVARALEYLARGANCAQSVVAAFGPSLGLALDICLKLPAAFGGGIARRGQLCGAVAGALMLLGLRHAESPLDRPEVKERLYQHAQEIIAVFTATCGSAECRELLGCDLNTPEGRQAAREANLFRTRCPEVIRVAAELCRDFLGERETSA